MPFPFSHVCDLLQQVCDLPPARRSDDRAVSRVVHAWFETHRAAIDALVAAAPSAPESTPGLAPGLAPGSSAARSSGAGALLSTLLPERRADRVYALQARALQRLLIRILGLGRSRIPELARWMSPSDPASYSGPVDLADCVEGILTRTVGWPCLKSAILERKTADQQPNPFDPGAPPVTVEEIDAVLHDIAARCRFSSPAVRNRALGTTASTPTQAALGRLGRLYQRLDARDAKWLTRLVLKDYRPVVLRETAVAAGFHPALPLALQVHADLEAAVQGLRGPAGTPTAVLGGTAPQPRPRLGVKVGRQQWAKARSIRHCIEMGGPQRMSCQRKMDGEYVQVHVDLSKGPDACLQLFSKSGKDSTRDRVNLHGYAVLLLLHLFLLIFPSPVVSCANRHSAIRESLHIGRPGCPVQKGCILEGEMLAYDETVSPMPSVAPRRTTAC